MTIAIIQIAGKYQNVKSLLIQDGHVVDCYRQEGLKITVLNPILSWSFRGTQFLNVAYGLVGGNLTECRLLRMLCSCGQSDSPHPRDEFFVSQIRHVWRALGLERVGESRSSIDLKNGRWYTGALQYYFPHCAAILLQHLYTTAIMRLNDTSSSTLFVIMSSGPILSPTC